MPEEPPDRSAAVSPHHIQQAGHRRVRGQLEASREGRRGERDLEQVPAHQEGDSAANCSPGTRNRRRPGTATAEPGADEEDAATDQQGQHDGLGTVEESLASSVYIVIASNPMNENATAPVITRLRWIPRARTAR